MELLIVQFSPASRLLKYSKYSPKHPVLKHNLCSSLNERDQISHKYKTAGKIIAFYVLIFKFLDSRREGVVLSTVQNTNSKTKS
jgi:hypothetical protein